jgi:hypothetical protein
MKIKLNNIVSFIGILFLLVVPVFAFTLSANAQVDNLLWGNQQTNIENGLGLGNEDPRVIAASVVNIMLGFLGIIAVLIILFGGFKWMTAGGNEDAIDQAKKMMTAGVIGLVIVLAAFGLAQFVINALYDATGAA